MSKRKKAASNNKAPLKNWGAVAPAPAPKRKSSRYLTLAIMGGAAFFVLRGCNDDEKESGSNQRFYTSVQECATKGNALYQCQEAWGKAKATLERDAPETLTPGLCQEQNDTNACYYNENTGSYLPRMTGFVLAKENRQCDPPTETCGSQTENYYSSHSSGGYWSSRPVWFNRSGEHVYRSRDPASRVSLAAPMQKTATLSRGGWGSSSRSYSSTSSRSNWGG